MKPKIQELTLEDFARLQWICAAGRDSHHTRKMYADEWAATTASVAGTIRHLGRLGLIEAIPERMVAPRLRKETWFRCSILAPSFCDEALTWMSRIRYGASLSTTLTPL